MDTVTTTTAIPPPPPPPPSAAAIVTTTTTSNSDEDDDGSSSRHTHNNNIQDEGGGLETDSPDNRTSNDMDTTTTTTTDHHHHAFNNNTTSTSVAIEQPHPHHIPMTSTSTVTTTHHDNDIDNSSPKQQEASPPSSTSTTHAHATMSTLIQPPSNHSNPCTNMNNDNNVILNTATDTGQACVSQTHHITDITIMTTTPTNNSNVTTSSTVSDSTTTVTLASAMTQGHNPYMEETMTTSPISLLTLSDSLFVVCPVVQTVKESGEMEAENAVVQTEKVEKGDLNESENENGNGNGGGRDQEQHCENGKGGDLILPMVVGGGGQVQLENGIEEEEQGGEQQQEDGKLMSRQSQSATSCGSCDGNGIGIDGSEIDMVVVAEDGVNDNRNSINNGNNNVESAFSSSGCCIEKPLVEDDNEESLSSWALSILNMSAVGSGSEDKGGLGYLEEGGVKKSDFGDGKVVDIDITGVKEVEMKVEGEFVVPPGVAAAAEEELEEKTPVLLPSILVLGKDAGKMGEGIVGDDGVDIAAGVPMVVSRSMSSGPSVRFALPESSNVNAKVNEFPPEVLPMVSTTSVDESTQTPPVRKDDVMMTDASIDDSNVGKELNSAECGGVTPDFADANLESESRAMVSNGNISSSRGSGSGNDGSKPAATTASSVTSSSTSGGFQTQYHHHPYYYMQQQPWAHRPQATARPSGAGGNAGFGYVGGRGGVWKDEGFATTGRILAKTPSPPPPPRLIPSPSLSDKTIKADTTKLPLESESSSNGGDASSSGSGLVLLAPAPVNAADAAAAASLSASALPECGDCDDEKELEEGVAGLVNGDDNGSVGSVVVDDNVGSSAAVESTVSTTATKVSDLNPMPDITMDETELLLPENLTLCITVYPYTADKNDELSFVEGMIIRVVRMVKGGWWEGQLDQRVGWFPANHVMRYLDYNGGNSGSGGAMGLGVSGGADSGGLQGSVTGGNGGNGNGVDGEDQVGPFVNTIEELQELRIQTILFNNEIQGLANAEAAGIGFPSPLPGSVIDGVVVHATIRNDGTAGNGIHGSIVDQEQQRAQAAVIEGMLADRERIVMDMLAGERLYVEALEGLIEKFVEPLLSERWFPEEDFAMFVNLEEVVEWHRDFVECLEGEVGFCGGVEGSGASGVAGADKWLIAKCFLDLSHRFTEVYSEYCSLLPKAVAVASKYSQDTNMIRFLTARGVNSTPPILHIVSLLHKPMQRKLKYSELLKVTYDQHPDYTNCLEARAAVADALSAVEMKKRQFENREIVRNLMRKLTPWEGPGLEHYGDLLLEGTLKLQEMGRPRERQFYLLEKILVIIRSERLSKKFKLLDKILMTKSSIKRIVPDIEGPDEMRLSFQIVYSPEDGKTKTLTVTAFNPDQKHRWLAMLQRQLDRNQRLTFPSLPRELQDEIRSIVSVEVQQTRGKRNGDDADSVKSMSPSQAKLFSRKKTLRWLSTWGSRIKKKIATALNDDGGGSGVPVDRDSAASYSSGRVESMLGDGNGIFGRGFSRKNKERGKVDLLFENNGGSSAIGLNHHHHQQPVIVDAPTRTTSLHMSMQIQGDGVLVRQSANHGHGSISRGGNNGVGHHGSVGPANTSASIDRQSQTLAQIGGSSSTPATSMSRTIASTTSSIPAQPSVARQTLVSMSGTSTLSSSTSSHVSDNARGLASNISLRERGTLDRVTLDRATLDRPLVTTPMMQSSAAEINSSGGGAAGGSALAAFLNGPGPTQSQTVTVAPVQKVESGSRVPSVLLRPRVKGDVSVDVQDDEQQSVTAQMLEELNLDGLEEAMGTGGGSDGADDHDDEEEVLPEPSFITPVMTLTPTLTLDSLDGGRLEGLEEFGIVSGVVQEENMADSSCDVNAESNGEKDADDTTRELQHRQRGTTSPRYIHRSKSESAIWSLVWMKGPISPECQQRRPLSFHDDRDMVRLMRSVSQTDLDRDTVATGSDVEGENGNFAADQAELWKEIVKSAGWEDIGASLGRPVPVTFELGGDNVDSDANASDAAMFGQDRRTSNSRVSNGAGNIDGGACVNGSVNQGDVAMHHEHEEVMSIGPANSVAGASDLSRGRRRDSSVNGSILRKRPSTSVLVEAVSAVRSLFAKGGAPRRKDSMGFEDSEADDGSSFAADFGEEGGSGSIGGMVGGLQSGMEMVSPSKSIPIPAGQYYHLQNYQGFHYHQPPPQPQLVAATTKKKPSMSDLRDFFRPRRSRSNSRVVNVPGLSPSPTPGSSDIVSPVVSSASYQNWGPQFGSPESNADEQNAAKLMGSDVEGDQGMAGSGASKVMTLGTVPTLNRSVNNHFSVQQHDNGAGVVGILKIGNRDVNSYIDPNGSQGTTSAASSPDDSCEDGFLRNGPQHMKSLGINTNVSQPSSVSRGNLDSGISSLLTDDLDGSLNRSQPSPNPNVGSGTLPMPVPLTATGRSLGSRGMARPAGTASAFNNVAPLATPSPSPTTVGAAGGFNLAYPIAFQPAQYPGMVLVEKSWCEEILKQHELLCHEVIQLRAELREVEGRLEKIESKSPETGFDAIGGSGTGLDDAELQQLPSDSVGQDLVGQYR
ncbi:Pleckstrin y domain-containing G member 1 [Blyttiomyces sp. JEL0837]|nr:Pleckstrin y domain-containing G member 1 [Blyttiomyces sp. JEL0837]